MAKYTYEFRNKAEAFPQTVPDVTVYKNIDDEVASVVNNVNKYVQSGMFDKAASEVATWDMQHPENPLSNYTIDSTVINRLGEDIRNTQIYARRNMQEIYIQESNPGEVDDGDVWVALNLQELPDVTSEDYTLGYRDGMVAADNRLNNESVSYREGYKNGAASASTEVDEDSASYAAGYDAGVEYADGRVNEESESYAAGMEAGRGTTALFYVTTSGWFNPTTVGSSTDTKTVNIAQYYPNYKNIRASNITVFIKTANGQGGDNLTSSVTSYNPSNGNLVIGCTAHFNNVTFAVLVRE